ncbi:preprotein translocase subunit Sec61beta [Candidatus Micrarchaeota archaeon]|nr:preprotein translocase subunit Sec61beta [Candidatus Micrarchaeota archaeon]MBU1930979.1 preprotein translocase subunit Sec61beta [Candidatus Micrarchaeota archaeon]
MSGPSSSLGIMRFFDVDSSGPKMTPELVMGIAIGFTILILVLQKFF